MNDKVFINALRLLPKSALSRTAGALTRWQAPAPLLQRTMRLFAARYRIDLNECDDLSSFQTFGDFFARPLRPGLRPIAPGEQVVVSPVDAMVSETGVAADGQLIQAKGMGYSVQELVADDALGARFVGGAYATLYLSPRDYHRIHFPLSGQVTGWRYLPGQLWPVNEASVRNVPKLFCVNERLVTLLATSLGLCAVVAVGATVVGRVRAFYDRSVPVTNRSGAGPEGRDYVEPIPVEKGAQLGAFEMGSTVILLFEPGRVRLTLEPGARLRVGEPIGSI